MMKKLSIAFMMVSLLLVIAFLTPAVSQTINLDKTYNWKMVSAMSTGQDGNKAIIQFNKTLEQKTNGKVRITLYEGTLGAPTDAWEMVKGNAVQFAHTSELYNPNRMPILGMVGLPMQFPDSKALWLTANEWLKAGYLKELSDNFKVIFFQSTDPLTVFFRKNKVTTLDDFKGLKIRCGGGTQSMGVAAMGAAGVSMSGGEQYMALQTGVIDGTITGIDMAIDRKFYEVTKYGLKQPLYFGMYVLLMNKETWNSLPPDLQKVMDQIGQEVSLSDNERRNAAQQALWNAYGKKAEIYNISKDEQAKWQKALAPVVDKYVQDTAAKGHPAKEALDTMRKVVNNYRR